MMKSLLHSPLFIALLFSASLFFLLYQLHHHPLCIVINTFNKVTAKKKIGGDAPYTSNYINTVRKIYTDKLMFRGALLDSLPIDNDSLFFLSLHQIINNFSVNANPYPLIIEKKNERLSCAFQMIAKRNFNLQIELKKEDNNYVFDKISNLTLLLDYHPEYLDVFDKNKP